MPNWCFNDITITHEDPEVIERLIQGLSNGGLFAKFIPIPQNIPESSQWAAQNWGTKWDIGMDCCTCTIPGPNEIRIEVYTAWSPPFGFF